MYVSATGCYIRYIVLSFYAHLRGGICPRKPRTSEPGRSRGHGGHLYKNKRRTCGFCSPKYNSYPFHCNVHSENKLSHLLTDKPNGSSIAAQPGSQQCLLTRKDDSHAQVITPTEPACNTQHTRTNPREGEPSAGHRGDQNASLGGRD